MDTLRDWLLRDAPELDDLEFVSQLAARLREAGIAVDRLWIGAPRRHPLLASVATLWSADGGARRLELPFADRGRMQWNLGEALSSPWVRLDLARAPAGAFGLPESLWADGYTEVILAFRTASGSVARAGSVEWLGAFFVTLGTKGQGGFGDAPQRLAQVDAALVASLRIRVLDEFTVTVARTYLGRGPGRQVLAGNVHRGDATTVRAAVAFVDLRGFTAMSEQEPPEVVLDLLNDYFDAVVGAIEATDGDVLQFMGDGLLAIWPDALGDGRAACDAALSAALDAERRVAHANELRLDLGKRPIVFGISLHLGAVSYGNMGAAHRLAYTVLGPAVNQAARLEPLGATHGIRPVLSRTFADATSSPCVRHGAVEVRGVGVLELWGVASVP